MSRTWCSAKRSWEPMAGKKDKKDIRLAPEGSFAFDDRGKQLVVADRSGVTFVDVQSRKSLGRSRGVRLERIQGPPVVAWSWL